DAMTARNLIRAGLVALVLLVGAALAGGLRDSASARRSAAPPAASSALLQGGFAAGNTELLVAQLQQALRARPDDAQSAALLGLCPRLLRPRAPRAHGRGARCDAAGARRRRGPGRAARVDARPAREARLDDRRRSDGGESVPPRPHRAPRLRLRARRARRGRG